jgi:phosphatidylglycerophosphatase A
MNTPDENDHSASQAGTPATRIDPVRPSAPQRPTVRFMLAHPAHAIALGFGSGLSRWAPGTVGTLWAWAAFVVADQWLTTAQWGWVIAASLPLGWWACTRTAQHLGTADPGAIVWDEVVAFWLILWLVMPVGLLGQAGGLRACSASSTPPSPARWAGPTGCLQAAPRPDHRLAPAAGASCSTTWWRRCARCWSSRCGCA